MPQYSPDGQWLWNGGVWQPATPLSPRWETSNQRLKLWRCLYLVAALEAAIAAAGMVFAVWGIVTAFPGDVEYRVTAPGTAEITLPDRGPYTISYEHRTAGGSAGEVPVTVPSDVGSMQLKLASTTSAAPVRVHTPSADFSYSDGSKTGVAIAEFSVDHPGKYALVSRYPNGQSGPPVVLAVGRGSPEAVDAYGVGILTSGGLGLGGLGTGVVALLIRINARGRARWEHRKAAFSRFDPIAIGRGLDRVYMLSQQHLPREVHAKVAAIRWSILELLPHASRFPLGSWDLFVLHKTASEYLPTSVDAYLALPASYATTFPLREGKTALQILGDQLDLLDTKVRDVSEAVRHQDSDRLLIHGRFLEESIGRQSSELSLLGTE